MVQQGPLRRSTATRLPAVIGVPDLVLARHVAVVKAAKRAKRSGVAADFHRLRIRCKRLRYSLEFSAELYEGRTSRYVRQLTALQDQLGLMQDDEVAAARLASPWPPHGSRTARRHHLHHGRRGPTPSPRGGTPAQAPARRGGPGQGQGLAGVAGRHGAPPPRRRGGAAPHPPRPARRPAPASRCRPCHRRGRTVSGARGRRHRGPWRPVSPHLAWSFQASGKAAASPITRCGCSVSTKCSWPGSKKRSMSAQMSPKSGSAMWAR